MIIKKITFTAVFAILLSAGISAATNGTLNLSGVVSGSLDIIVTPEAVASTLDLTTDQNDLLVATVTEKSNKASGYTVTLESANATSAGASTGLLEGPSSLAYTMKYDSSVVTLSSGSAVITDTTNTTDSAGVTKNFHISYTGNNSLTEGTYSDTLTFTIAAK